MIEFQYYDGNIRNTKPLGVVALDKFVEVQRQPKQSVKDTIEAISNAATPEIKKKLKEKLYFFTPSVILRGGRSYTNIESFTGLLVLDFDHVDNAEKLRDVLYERYLFIIASWTSPSRKGVKCLVSIPVCKTVGEFKSYYWGLYKEMCVYAGLDTTGQNPVLPLFLSYDKDIKYRELYCAWDKKGKNPNEMAYLPVASVPKFDSTDIQKRNINSIIESIIMKAYNNGHPTVTKAALVLGGYVGYGYFNEVEAVSIMERLIDGNDYLSKKASTYKNTARYFINKGMGKPIELTKQI